MINNISILDKKSCVSCRSCEQVCPKFCINMQENDEGFLYPIVKNFCVNCGLCVNHCPILSPVQLNWISPERYALILKKDSILNKSSSGGLFGGIAEYILNNNGIVYGAAYDENLRVHHIGIVSCSDLYKIQSSKYVSSDTEKTYQEIETLLKMHKVVLFGGSPCQIAGLNSYLGKFYDNLYTMDLICHGVPSAKLFLKYLDWLGKKLHDKIIYYGFRDKSISGWACGGKTLVKTSKKNRILEGVCEPYYAAFLRCETYRESCYVCPYAKRDKRAGDITMGDFWGTDKQYFDISPKNGISFCSINTQQGKKLFELVRDSFYVYDCPNDEKLNINVAYHEPSKRPVIRDTIYNGINSDNKEYFKNFSNISYIKFYFQRIVIKLVPKYVRKLLKRVLKK